MKLYFSRNSSKANTQIWRSRLSPFSWRSGGFTYDLRIIYQGMLKHFYK